MAVTICHASIDENGRANSGAAGDQTGKEVCTRTWYSKPWGVMLRYKDASVAKKAATIAKKLANSNLVGYDQYQRNTLYQALKSYGWDVDKYIKSGKKTETDCSAFMYACYCCLISSMRSDSNAPTTSTMQSFFTKHGFTAYTASKYISQDTYLTVGDVLVKPSSHTVMAVTNGSGASSSSSSSTTSTTASTTSLNKTAKWTGKVTASSLNVRSWAGTENSVLRSLAKGTKVSVCDTVKDSSGASWYYIKESGKYGFVSSAYIAKV